MTVDWNGNLKIAGDLQDMNGNSLLSQSSGDNSSPIVWITLDLPKYDWDGNVSEQVWEATTVTNNGEITGIGYWFNVTIKVPGKIDTDFNPLFQFSKDYYRLSMKPNICYSNYDESTNITEIKLDSDECVKESYELNIIENKDGKIKLGFFKAE